MPEGDGHGLMDLGIVHSPLCPVELGNIATANVALVTYDHFEPTADAQYIANETAAILVAEAETVSRFNMGFSAGI